MLTTNGNAKGHIELICSTKALDKYQGRRLQEQVLPLSDAPVSLSAQVWQEYDRSMIFSIIQVAGEDAWCMKSGECC